MLALTLGGVGCQGEISDPASTRPTDPDGPPPLDCSELQPGRSPMRRLTVDEYDNTVRDLLGDGTAPAARLIDDERGVTSADARLVTTLLVEQYLAAAEDVAARAVADLPTLLECDRATVGDDECARRFIERVGTRAYRRPIAEDEATALYDLYAIVKSEMTFAEGIQAVVEAILQAPAFLYRPEIVPMDGEPIVRLDGYQIATRLSYFLWATTPDEFLLEAAANGELDDDDAVAAHARRLLDDPRAEGAIQRFFHRYLELDQLEGLSKDPAAFPDFQPAIAELMRQETEAFIHAVLVDPDGDRSWTTLMSADWSMMNAELAAYYGVEGPSGEAFERVALDPAHHSGLLTQGSLMATRARSYESSPVHRGMFVRGNLLCGIVPDVPENLEVDPPDPDPSLTTRERLAEHREDPACGACHRSGHGPRGRLLHRASAHRVPGLRLRHPRAIPRRVIFFFTSCGPVPETWWPSGGETDFTLPMALQPLEPFRDRLLIPDGVQMTTAIERSGGRNGHDIGTGHAMVCRPLAQGPSGFGEFGHLWDGSAGGISIDQHIANAVGGDTRFASLEYGVKAEGIRQAVPSRISYRAAFEPVIPMHRPGAAFDRVFGPLTGDAAAQARRARRRELVLGAVQGELGRLRPRLGTDDRRRVDAHMAAIEDITGRLDGLDGAVCNVPERGDSTNVPEWGRLHMDMMARALACDLTRVASLQWVNGQSYLRHEWLGQSDSHHSLSHRGDSDADARAQVSQIDRWYGEQLAYLLGALDAVEAGDGSTLLDHTTVVWVNEQMKGIGNVHRFSRMPYIIAGGGGGYWRSGRYVDTAGRSHSDMFVNVMHAMGMEETSFGDPEFCTGPIDSLT